MITSLVFCSKLVGHSEPDVVWSLLGSSQILVEGLGSRYSPVLVALVLNSLVDVDILAPAGSGSQRGLVGELVVNSTTESDWGALNSFTLAPVVDSLEGVSSGVIELVVTSSTQFGILKISSKPVLASLLWYIDALSESLCQFLGVVLSSDSEVNFITEQEIEFWSNFLLKSFALLLTLGIKLNKLIKN